MMNCSRTTHECRFHPLNLILAALVLLQLAFVASVEAEPGNDQRAPELGDCQELQVPAGNKAAFHVYADGVVGTVLERCTPDPSAIPWLLLKAVSNEGPGIFHRVTFIQRVNTVGGNAPTDAGDFVGEVVKVPYTAEYYFYRAHQ